MTTNTFHNSNIIQADIIIVGGGVIGLSLANLCANEEFSVILVEREQGVYDEAVHSAMNHPDMAHSQTTVKPFHKSNLNNNHPDDFDIRCFALSRASQHVFELLNLWNEYIQPNASSYSHMHVWDGVGFGEISFSSEEIQEQNLGHIVEQRVLLKALWQLTHSKTSFTPTPGKITLAFNQYPKHLAVDIHQATLTLQNGVILSAKLVVGAEGAHSSIRSLAEIKIEQRSYEQSALVATVQTEYPHQQTAWQRFIPKGPIAFLPLSDPRFCSIVWTTTPEMAQMLAQLPQLEFCEALAQAFDFRLGKILKASIPKVFPLTLTHATHYIKPRVAIVGDAAHVIHPLAGQGINLGMQDVTQLIQVLTQARTRGCDIGEFLILRKYARMRKAPVGRMIYGMEFFKTFFGSKMRSISWLRNMGLQITNKTPLIKRQLIRIASGI